MQTGAIQESFEEALEKYDLTDKNPAFLFLFLLMIIYATARLNNHPSQTTILYVSSGGSASVFTIIHLKSRKLIAERVNE